DGTKMNTLEHFLNIDDLLVLRKKDLTDQHKKKIIELTLRQVGKPYDFNYDVETTDKIVCSQLVYLAYTDIDWPTDSHVGRYTISPDNIVKKALHEGELEIILLFSDGKQVMGDVTAFMGRLMGQ
ncbi:MAG: Poxvirus G6, partial [Methyloprofundus sp.]|nr:Poxvirus G6 [Methyloprofundus sp.]